MIDHHMDYEVLPKICRANLGIQSQRYEISSAMARLGPSKKSRPAPVFQRCKVAGCLVALFSVDHWLHTLCGNFASASELR